MKKKIFARTLNPETFDYRVYDIREDDYNELIIDGGRSFCDVDSKDYLSYIKKVIKEYDSWDLEYYYHNSIKDFLDDYFPLKENGKKRSFKENGDIHKALESNDKENIICLCLKVVTGKQYTCSKLRGCCQGDIVTAYYPVTYKQSYIDWVEAWYFGTGIEIEIDDTGRENIESPEDIEGFTFYTSSWRKEDLIKEIKDEFGAKEDDDIEVVLWEFTGYRTVHIDQYKLVD